MTASPHLAKWGDYRSNTPQDRARSRGAVSPKLCSSDDEFGQQTPDTCLISNDALHTITSREKLITFQQTGNHQTQTVKPLADGTWQPQQPNNGNRELLPRASRGDRRLFSSYTGDGIQTTEDQPATPKVPINLNGHTDLRYRIIWKSRRLSTPWLGTLPRVVQGRAACPPPGDAPTGHVPTGSEPDMRSHRRALRADDIPCRPRASRRVEIIELNQGTI